MTVSVFTATLALVSLFLLYPHTDCWFDSPELHFYTLQTSATIDVVNKGTLQR